MGKYFDAQAALAEIQGSPIHPIHPIPSAENARNRTNSTNRVPPDLEIFEERAAICEFDGGLSRADAEQLAAECQGYDNVVAFRVSRGYHARVACRALKTLKINAAIWGSRYYPCETPFQPPISGTI